MDQPLFNRILASLLSPLRVSSYLNCALSVTIFSVTALPSLKQWPFRSCEVYENYGR